MAKVAVEDLSGTSTPVTANPYDGLIQACNNDPKQIQARYQHHRISRNAQQKDKILSPKFPGWILDDTLTKLDGPQRDADFEDPRNCLVFWARPTSKIKHLIQVVQQKLKDAVPDIWLMPIDNLHMTALEIAHSLTPPQIEALAAKLLPASQMIADYPSNPRHSARLIKPSLSFDAAALALSFVPAAGEALPSPNLPSAASRKAQDDDYTYHHLRRDVYSLVTKAGIEVGSRYVVPSAHLTIARFNTPNPFDPENPLDAAAGRDEMKRMKLLKEMETINSWLEQEFWPRPARPRRSVTQILGDGHTDVNGEDRMRGESPGEAEDAETTMMEAIKPGGEWIVGEEKGLDFRKGTLWYGGGETIYLGKGTGH